MLLALALSLIGVGASALGVRAQSGGAKTPFRLDQGRYTLVAYPRDRVLARSLLARALARDTFPGLPRPRARVLIALAPDRATFRAWIGPHAPEWGAAIAFPLQQRVVMQGSAAGSDAGDPLVVLRHELAHLALHEAIGDLPPRWFDEGYASFAAGEWGRDEVLATNLALVVRGVPKLEALDDEFQSGSERANAAYALAHRAVAELAALDRDRGLTNLFEWWKSTGSLDVAVRRAYGMTLGGFDDHWRARTRRVYGTLALATELATASAFIGLAILPFWLARRRRDRQRMAALRAADRREDALAAFLGEGSPEPWAADAAEGSPTRPTTSSSADGGASASHSASAGEASAGERPDGRDDARERT